MKDKISNLVDSNKYNHLELEDTQEIYIELTYHQVCVFGILLGMGNIYIQTPLIDHIPVFFKTRLQSKKFHQVDEMDFDYTITW